MKIVHFVLSDSFAGIEQHVDEVLTNFSSHKLILICNESIASYFDKSINIYKVKNFGRRSFFGKYKLKKLIKDIDPDIIHTHGSKTSSIISSIKTKNYKHVATIHGVKKNKKIYEKADLIIGVSDKALEGINHETICINNWWHPKLKKIQNKKNKHALSVGRLEKVKGFDLLIASWKNICTNLVIIGSGKERNKLNELIEQNNLSEKVKIIDAVKKEELLNYYQDASVLIISSRDEGGPRVALEALYLEIPVISTDVGHMSQILPKELLAEKNNQSALQDMLEKYVDNIHLYNQKAIFNFVEREFSIEEKMQELNDAYSLLASKS
jgi:glycosyltransferase involved in cell wall biosynthesis